MKVYKFLVLALLFLLLGCDQKKVEQNAAGALEYETKQIRVQPNASQRLVASHSESRSESISFQLRYQQINGIDKPKPIQIIQLDEIVAPTVVYRGLYPVSFASQLYGFVLLVGQDAVGEMQGYLFVWNGKDWRYDAASNVLLNNLTAESEISARLDKVFPHDGLNNSLNLMMVRDIQAAKQVLGDVYHPELQVDLSNGKKMSVLAKLDTGSPAVFLLEESGNRLNVHRLPSPMDSTDQPSCKPLKAQLKECKLEQTTWLSVVYNCQSPVHNQDETHVDLFQKRAEVWVHVQEITSEAVQAAGTGEPLSKKICNQQVKSGE